MTESVLLEKRNHTALLTLNRPQSFNAFGGQMVRELADILTSVSSDDEVTGVIITGKGKAFCAGGDLRWLEESGLSYYSAFHKLAAIYHRAVLEIRRMPKPVFAAINGFAAGGGFSMALACDFRVMDSSAILRQAYTSNGLSIDGGGTFTLPRIVGISRALEIAAFDQPIDAERALKWGLVTEVAEEGNCLDRALELLKRITDGSLSSFAAVKRLLTDSFSTSFETQIEKERESLSLCANHPNGREGVTAFLEKRKPVFNK